MPVDQRRRLTAGAAPARARYDQATACLDPPLAAVDLGAFDRNAADLTRRERLSGDPGLATLFSGGYVASGTGTPDRLPRPYLRAGLRLLGTEGAGEVQTPVRGAAAGHLQPGGRRAVLRLRLRSARTERGHPPAVRPLAAGSARPGPDPGVPPWSR